MQAAAEHGSAITLASAPDAGLYAGPGWFAALVDAARIAVPEARFSSVLDCGDDSGAAMAGVRAGVESVAFTGRTDVAARLAAIAAARGSRLWRERPAARLDLGELMFADTETLRRRCIDALRSG